MPVTYYPGVNVPVSGIITEAQSSLTTVAVSSAFLWNINNTSVTSTLEAQWDVFLHGPPGKSVNWNIHNRVTTSQQSAWNNLHIIKSQQASAFLTPQTRSSVKKFYFNARQRVTSVTKTFNFNTRSRIKPQQQATFNTRKKVTASVTSKFNTRKKVIKTRQCLFNVLYGHISASTSVQFNISARVKPNSGSCQWNVSKRITTTRKSQFKNVAANISVSATKKSAFNIKAHVTHQKVFNFNVRDRVIGTDLTVEFNTLKRVKPSQHSTFNAVGRVRATKTCQFKVYQRVSGS